MNKKKMAQVQKLIKKDNQWLKQMDSPCHCPQEYSIERHGQGWALYLGNCNHKHGLFLAKISELDEQRIKDMITLLNRALRVTEQLD
jgi:hypothetical protein